MQNATQCVRGPISTAWYDMAQNSVVYAMASFQWARFELLIAAEGNVHLTISVVMPAVSLDSSCRVAARADHMVVTRIHLDAATFDLPVSMRGRLHDGR